MTTIFKAARGIDYAAKVIKLSDKAQFLMAQVEIPELLEGADIDLMPWATYLLPVGARANEGDFNPVAIGDWVWVDFPYVTHGEIDTRKPRIKGSMHFAPDEVPNLPHECFEGADTLVHKRTATETKPKPKKANEARVVTIGFATIELEKDGALRLTSRKTGSAFEICEEGDMVSHSEGKQFSSSKDITEVISGKGYTIKVLSENAVIEAAEIHLGASGLEPHILGDQLAAFMAELKTLIENHIHIGDLGAPTSNVLAAMGPWDFSKVLAGGSIYSTKNKGQ
jgi:hypothetical protein